MMNTISAQKAILTVGYIDFILALDDAYTVIQALSRAQRVDYQLEPDGYAELSLKAISDSELEAKRKECEERKKNEAFEAEVQKRLDAQIKNGGDTTEGEVL